jgi:hypothetical protein
MIQKLRYALLCIYCALLIPLHAQAADGVFQKYDKNADGKVTTDELPYPRVFARFDTNKDGSITSLGSVFGVSEYEKPREGTITMLKQAQ